MEPRTSRAEGDRGREHEIVEVGSWSLHEETRPGWSAKERNGHLVTLNVAARCRWSTPRIVPVSWGGGEETTPSFGHVASVWVWSVPTGDSDGRGAHRCPPWSRHRQPNGRCGGCHSAWPGSASHLMCQLGGRGGVAEVEVAAAFREVPHPAGDGRIEHLSGMWSLDSRPCSGVF